MWVRAVQTLAESGKIPDDGIAREEASMGSLQDWKTVVVTVLSKVRLVVPGHFGEFSFGKTSNGLDLVEPEFSET